MKKLLLLAFSTCSILAAPGCLDNSYHLSQAFDNKNYHLVSTNFSGYCGHCQCPCRNTIADRGKCLDCGHYRYPQPWVIIRTSKK